MITFVGSLNMGGITPISVTAAAGLSAAIAADLAGIALLTAGLNIFPPSFSASITGIGSIVLGLNAMISASLPTIDFQAAAVAVGIAEVSAQLAIPLQFEILLGGGAGIFLYGFDGITNTFGSTVTSALSTGWPDGTLPSSVSNAIILATVSDTVWDDMLSFFGAVPPSLPTGLTYLAQADIGYLTPLCVTATAGITASLKAKLAGLIALAVQLSVTPPTFAASLSLCVDMIASLNAAISANLPGVSFQLDAIAALVARLNANLDLLASLTLTLGGAAGIFVYTYSGPGGDMGGEITAAISGGWPNGASPTIHSNAIIMGTVSPAVWATLGLFFGGV